MDTGLFSAGKAAGRHVDPSPASSAKIENDVYFCYSYMPSRRGQGHLYLYFSFTPSLVIFILRMDVEKGTN